MSKSKENTAEIIPGTENEHVGETVSGTENTDGVRPQDGEDVNDDNSQLVALANTITLATIACKPKPSRDENGKPETVNYGTDEKPNIKVKYVDQDLCVMAGRATAYCFVETANGTSLELIGDFKAQSLTPDHNGEIDVVTRGPKIILPSVAQKMLISGVEAQGLPIGMFGDVEKNGETSTARTVVTQLKEPILFAYIIQAQGSATVTGYQYRVKTVEKARLEAAPADTLLASALKKRKVMQLAAPGSKHAG